MATGTLYTYPGNFRAYKILIAAEYSGVPVRVVAAAPEFVLGETNKTPDFLKKFPAGKVPAFEISGNNIFETNAIAHYVGNDQLRGPTALDQAHVLQWTSFADNEILPAACSWVFPCLGVIQYNKQVGERSKEDIKRVLSILDQHLLTRTFLVGERVTQADISVFCTLLMLYQHVLEPAFRQPFGNVNRWFVTLLNQPQFKTVVGDIQLCQKMAQFDAKKFADMQGKSKDKGSKAKEVKQHEPKSEKKKEQPKKVVIEEPPEEMDETELALAQQPKTKDPFEAFPKGNFNMDEFKRIYSNEDEATSVKYFWEKFDAENYSIWYSEYKYPEDLTLVFMSCNLISGMFQRLDKMRKNAFASVILFGEDHKSTISGIWVWRGHQLAFPMSADWQVDYESYDWKKLDPNTQDTKKLVTEYLQWSGDFGGKAFNQGKIFK